MKKQVTSTEKPRSRVPVRWNKITVILTALICHSVVAQEQPRGVNENAAAVSPWSIGAGMVVKESEYRGVDFDMMAFPAIGYRGRHISLQGIRGIWHLNRYELLAVDLFVQPRFSRFKASDSAFLSGMKRRKMTAEAGLQGRIRLPARLTANVKISADVLNIHQGHTAELSISRAYPFFGMLFIPFLKTEFFDDNIADYYYGVQTEEAAENRPAYTPGHLINFSSGCRLTRRFSRRIAGMLSLQLNRLDDNAYRSPIVSSRVNASVLAVMTITL